MREVDKEVKSRSGNKISRINLGKRESPSHKRRAPLARERASGGDASRLKVVASQRWLSPGSLVGEVIVLTGVYRSSTLCGYGGISH